MRRLAQIFLVFGLLLACIGWFSVVSAADLTFVPLSAEIVEQIDADLGMGAGPGIVMEIQVVNSGDEIKLWPIDFSVGALSEGQEVRVPGYMITNAVSDPEDDMSYRFLEGTTVRKGTRYFKLFFYNMFDWQFYEKMETGFDEATLYFRVPAADPIPIKCLEVEEPDEYYGD